MNRLLRACLIVAIVGSGSLSAFTTTSNTAFAMPVPAVLVSVGSSNMPLGSAPQFTVTFNNAGVTDPTTGYGPYIDLFLPAGADGAIASPRDGLSLSSATYLGVAVEKVLDTTCPVDGTFKHPLTMLETACTPTDQVVVLRLPFGSFTAGQPAVAVTVNTNMSNLADVGVPLTLKARAGFQFGELATGSTPITGTEASASVTPYIFNVTKSYLGPESETATGPNFVRQYQVNASIASTITISDLVLIDNIPNSLAYTGTIATNPSATISETPALNVAAAPNTMTVQYPTATGNPYARFSFFVPYTDSDGLPVLTPDVGQPVPAVNDVLGYGTWTPIDPRDVGDVITSDVTLNDHTVYQKSLAIQKSVSVVGGGSTSSVVPGSVVEYALDFQVSDFFAFDHVLITDTLADGLRFDASYTPTLQGNGNGFSLSAAPISAANFSVVPNYTPASSAPNDGSSQILVDVSNEISALVPATGGKILGGCVPTSGVAEPDCDVFNDGPTTFRVTFRAIVQDSFSDTPVQGVSKPIDTRITLNNGVRVAGDVLNDLSLEPTGSNVQDTSGASVRTASVSLVKTIYAIDGVVCSPQPCNNVFVTNGLGVTFRLRYTMPTGDVSDLVLEDYLPLPIFDVDDVLGFTPTITATAPPVGYATFGPSHTFDASIVPTMTLDSANNAFRFDFGDADDPDNIGRVVDVLVTVPAFDRPYIDGLLFTNFVQSHSANSLNQSIDNQTLVQMTLSQPSTFITKSVVAVSNAAGIITPSLSVTNTFAQSGCPRFSSPITTPGLADSPINANLSNVDGGDKVTYAILVENIGSAPTGAFDVVFSDTLPAQATFVPGSLCVTNGAGTALTYTGSLTQGLSLVDSSLTQGALARGYTPATKTYTDTGRNIAVVTYDAVLNTGDVAPQATVSSTIVNTATLSSYAASEGGYNYVSQKPLSDTAKVTLAPPQFDKALAGTELAPNAHGALKAAVGELITYTLTMSVPEGVTPNVIITDALDSGLTYAQFVGIAASPNITRDGSFDEVLTPTVSASGLATWTVGSLFNANSDNTVTDTLTITYTALALNVAANQSGTVRSNNARLSYASTGVITAATVPTVTIVEPAMTLSKTVSPRIADAGDTLYFTVTVTNTGGTNGSTAYDVVLTDVLPSDMTYVPGSLTTIAGVPAVDVSAGNIMTATWLTFTQNTTSVVRYAATLNASVIPSQSITSTDYLAWTSVPGSLGARSPYTATSVERDGTGGINDYFASVSASITVTAPSIAKWVVTTEVSETNNSAVTQATIGELITYTVMLTVPEGTSNNVHITDTLDSSSGLAWVACSAISASSSITTDKLGGFDALCDGSSAPVPGVNGLNAAFDLGNLTNTDNNNAVAEHVQITYTVAVLNIAGNTTGKNLRNRVNYTQQGISMTAQAANVSVVQPAPGISTTALQAFGDAHDPITYTLIITNNAANSATAYDMVITDPLPLRGGYSLILTPTIAVVDTAGLVNASAFDIIGSETGYTLTTVAPFDLPYSSTRRITVTVMGFLSPWVVPSSTITNAFTGVWTSMDGLAGVQRSISNTTSVERNYTSTVSAATRIYDLSPLKRVSATSEPGTGIGADNTQRAAIGEIVTYRLRMRLPEAANDSVHILMTDTLPYNMNFITGTARVAFDYAPSGGGGITSSVVSTASPDCSALDIDIAGDPITATAGSVTCPLPATQVTTATAANATRIVFDLGTVYNLQDDANTEYAVVEFDAQTLNVITNTAGITINNVFSAAVAGFAVQGSTSGAYSSTVTVAEPQVRIRKTVTPMLPFDAGDTVTYTIVVTNATGQNVSPAYDLTVTDVADSRLVPITPATITTPNGVVVTDTSAGQTVAVAVSELQPGGTITITARMQVASAVASGSAISNTANVAWTSVPGITGTVPNSTTSNTSGAAGTTFGERTGSGGLNSYFYSSTALITLTTPLIMKLAPSPSQYTIGDAIAYTLVVTLPEGSTQALNVLDDMVSGLTYSSSQIITQAVDSGGLLSADFAGDALAPTVTNPNGDALFAFGNVTVADDNVNNNTFLIRVTALVANIVGNQTGSVLTNTAQLTYTNPVSGVVGVSGGSRTISVIEPKLTTAKSVTPFGNVQAGDTLTYTVRVTNTGTSTAYNVTLTDTLPGGVDVPALVACTINGNNAASQLSGSAPNIAISPTVAGGWVVPVGQVLVCNYIVVAQTSLYANSTFTNTADADWASQDIDNSGGRTYNDSGSYAVDGVQDTASAAFTSSAVTFSKTDGGVVTATIGSHIVYTLTVDAPLGTLRNLVITDVLPGGLSYIAGSTRVGDNISPQPSVNQSGQSLVWSFGDALISPTNMVTISFGASMADVVTNTAPLTHTNVATLTYRTGTGGMGGPLTSSDGLTLTEPSLSIGKSVIPARTPSGAGDTVTYTVRLTNTGTSPAFDVTITDALPSGLTFIATQAFNASGGTTTDDNTFGATALSYGASQINAGGTAVITFTARIDDAIGVSSVLTNSARATYSSLSGAMSGERTYTTTTATASITTGTPALSLSKSVTPTSAVAPGTPLLYTIIITNTGIVAATDVVVTDAVPANTAFAAATEPFTGPNPITWTVGSLEPNGTRTFTLSVTANEPLPNNTILTNTAHVTSTQGLSRTATVTNAIASAHALTLTKQVTPQIAAPGDTLTYTLVYTVAGSEAATSVVLTDALPNGVSFVDASSSPSAQAGQIQTWTLGTATPTQTTPVTGTIVLTAQVSGTAVANGTTRVNNARLSDAAGLSSTATATVTLNTAHTLAISKQALTQTATAGMPLTYTIVYTVAGNEPSLNPTVRDTLPAGTAFASCSDGCSQNSGVVTWALGASVAPTTGTLTLAVNVDSTVVTGTQLVNAVAITDAQGLSATSTVTMPVVALADVGVRKLDMPDPVVAGQILTYTFAISNVGPSTAQDVALTDVLPSGLTLLTCDASSATCLTAGQSLTTPFGALLMGQSFAVTVTARVGDAVLASTVLTNIAFVGSSTPDANLSNNQSTATTTVSAVADVSVLKLATPEPVFAGDVLTYTLIVSNSGPSTAQNVVLTDVVPVVMSLIGTPVSTSSGNAVNTTSALTVTYAALTPGQTETVTVVTRVSSNVSHSSALPNTVYASSSTFDPNLANNQATVTTTVLAAAGLEIVKTASPDVVVAGQTLTYRMVVFNSGPSQVNTVTMTDVLPPQVTFVSCDAAANPCTNAAGTISATTPALTVGQSMVVTVVATVNANVLTGTQIVNTAVVTSVTQDPDLSNNTSTVTTTVRALADVSVLKSGVPDPVVAGQTMTYTLTYANAGPSDAQNVRITDTLPTGLSFGGVLVTTPTLAAPSVTGSTIAFDVDTVAANGSGSIVFTTSVGGTAAATIINTAIITTSTPDSNTSNNTASDSASVLFADVAIGKVVTPTRAVVAGETVTYTLAISNVGNAPAQDVQVTDALPNGVTWNGAYTSSVMANVSALGQQVTWSVGQLSVGESAAIVFSATVDGRSDAIVRFTNVATITTSTPQTNTANDTAQAVTSRLDLRIRKTGATSDVAVNWPVNFTIVVTNTGDGVLETVPLTDTYDSTVLAFNTASITPTSATLGQLTWANVGPIQPGASATVTVNFTALTTTHGLNTTNVATVTATTQGATLPPQSSSAEVRVRVPVLSVRKTALTPSVQPSGIATYTVVISNSGDAAASNVVMSDSLPMFTTLVADSVSVTPLAGRVGNAPILARGLTVMPNESMTVTYAVRLTSPLTDGLFITNTVAVSSTEAPSPVNASAVIQVQSAHTLAISKSAFPAQIRPGEEVTFTLVFTITGNEPVKAVRVSDVLPAETTFVRAIPSTANAPSIGSKGTVTWSFGDMLTATQGITQWRSSVQVVARADVPLPNGHVITNTAQVTDQSGLTADASATVLVKSSHTLALSKRAHVDWAMPGDLLTYTLVYTLTGNEPARNVVLRDVTPEHTTFVAAEPSALSPGVGNAGEVTWSLGDFLLQSTGTTQASGSVMLVVRVNDSVPETLAYISNHATVGDDSGQTADADAQTPIPADVTIAKFVSTRLTVPDAPLTYTLVVTNNGPGLARNVTLTDTLPQGVTFVSASSGYVGLRPISWSLGDMAAGEVRMVNVMVNSPASGTNDLVNWGKVGTESPDVNQNNNDSAAETLSAPPEFAVSKSVTPGGSATVSAGDHLTYTIWVTNTGRVPAPNVKLIDPIPVGTQYVPDTAWPFAVFANNQLVWTIKELGMGEVVSATFSVSVLPVTDQSGINNVASVGAKGVEESTESNRVTTVLKPTDIVLTLFSAKRTVSDTVDVRWITASERDVFGFQLYRATSPQRSLAEPVSDVITARGGNVVTEYNFTDEAPPLDGDVWYWLEEVLVDGGTIQHGPASTAIGPNHSGISSIFLPTIVREFVPSAPPDLPGTETGTEPGR